MREPAWHELDTRRNTIMGYIGAAVACALAARGLSRRRYLVNRMAPMSFGLPSWQW